MTEPPPSPARRSLRPSRVVGIVTMLVGGPAAWWAGSRLGEPPPRAPMVASAEPIGVLRDFGALPAFSLTREGDPATASRFGSAELAGKVWIADFVFTTCGSVCPRLTKSMRALQDKVPSLGDRTRLVSITVDPENDTPDILRTYAREAGADAAKWVFLTGPSDEVQAVVSRGFRVAMDKRPEVEHRIFHAERFVLVDPQMHVRGYYENEPRRLDDLVRDVGVLLAASPAPSR